MTWGEIDEQAVIDASQLIGVPLRRDRMQWVRCATSDAIRHFVWGIGESNPLYLNADYAASTRWDGLLAPPCFLYAADYTVVAPKLPGVQWIYAGTDWSWFDVIRVDDEFSVVATLEGQREMSGRTFSRWLMQEGRIEYRRQDGALIGVALGRVARTPRARQAAPDGPAESCAAYSPDEIEQIEQQVLSEPVRGAQVRYWEDVNVGDEIPAVVRGPLSIVDIVAWYSATQGAQPYGGVHGDVLRYRQRHADYHLNERTGAKDSAGRGHLEGQTGKDVGMGGAYDVGPQRIAWAGHMLSNWHGDGGFLHQLNVQVRRPNLVGDTTWWTGEVVTKSQREEGGFLSIRVQARNQSGVATAWGTAVVLLPSIERGPIQLPLKATYELSPGGRSPGGTV